MADIESLISRLKEHKEVAAPQQDCGEAVHFVFKHTTNSPLPEDEAMSTKGFPESLVALWRASNGVRLFEEVNYGQWGLVLYGFPEITEKSKRLKSIYVDHLDCINVIIGEFLGDADIPLICNNPSNPDFGAVFVALPGYSRDEWYKVADDLAEFLEKFLVAQGEKYWE